MKKSSINPEECNSFYHNYLKLVDDDASLVDSLYLGKERTIRFYGAISNDKLNYAYAEGKWTILEVLQHVIDTERIFAYRVLRIARNDKTELAGFDQDDYIKPSQANSRNIEDLLEEYSALRTSNIYMIQAIPDECFKNEAIVSGGRMTARAAAFIMLGHEIHHANIIQERYL